MKIEVTQGIVLRASDYLDRDKIVSILTPDYGLVSAKIKGGKGKSSNLKFAMMPFCYAQFELAMSGLHPSVLTAVEIENFFDITKDYLKFVYGSAILELTNIIAPILEDSVLFTALVKALHTLRFSATNPGLVFFRFALGVFKVTGYQFNTDLCGQCNTLIKSALWSHKTGALVCENCARFGDVSLSGELLDLLKTLPKIDFDALDEIDFNHTLEQECNILVQNNCNLHFTKLNSLKQLL